jgi:hypothetical protein
MGDSPSADLRAQAEIEKIRAETEALRRPAPYTWTNWIPLIAGLGALFTATVGGVIQWRLTDLQIERQKIEADRKTVDAQKATVSAQEEVLKLKSERADIETAKKLAITELTAAREKLDTARLDFDRIQSEARAALEKTNDPTTRQTLTSVVSSATAASNTLARRSQLVYLLFRGGVSREILKELQTLLGGAGYSVPGVERVGSTYTSEVRYFRSEDEEDAKQIASLATRLFTEKKCTIPSPILPKFAAVQTPPNQIDVWISLSCPD